MTTKQLLEEAKAKHRHIKKELLYIIESCPKPNWTKEKIQDRLFELYKEIK